jgi:plastocyanin domain-containing protein
MKSFFLYTGIALLGFGLIYFWNGDGNEGSKEPVNNVSMVGGQQIIEISAKGGYSPQINLAKAGVPTTLKVSTSGTFDCSSSLVIPSLNFAANLASTGTEEIEIPAQEPGSTLQGVCGMGMYNFSIKFL